MTESAGTYMQISDLCKSCSKQNFCGNGMTDYYCTGYAPCVETRCDIKVPPFTDGQKQLIEMTEKLAEKRGGKICDVDGIDEMADGRYVFDTDVYLDALDKKKPMTNEEHIRSCSAEELVGIIYEWFSVGHVRGKFGKPLDSPTVIEEWLKEKHE